jgi:hypothetical protein
MATCRTYDDVLRPSIWQQTAANTCEACAMAGAQSKAWMVVGIVGGVLALVAVLVEAGLIQMAVLDTCTWRVPFAC